MNVVLILIAILCFILLLIVLSKESSLKKQNTKLAQENADLDSEKLRLIVENGKLKHLNAELSIYQNALNVDREAKERLEKAKQDAELLIRNAEKKMQYAMFNVQSKADGIIEQANKEAEYVMFNSKSQAKGIIEQANKKASSVAMAKKNESKPQKREKGVAADRKNELTTEIDFEVSGLYYRGEEAIEEVQQLISGDLLHFLHEPTNKNDRYAMKVLTDNGVFIGYVEKSFSRIFYEYQKDFIDCVVTRIKKEYKVPYVHAQVRYYGNVEGLGNYAYN